MFTVPLTFFTVLLICCACVSIFVLLVKSVLLSSIN